VARLVTLVGTLALASSATLVLAQPAPSPADQLMRRPMPGLRPMPGQRPLPGERAIPTRPRRPLAEHAAVAAPHAAPEAAEGAHEVAHEGHHCPGHGPTDKPQRVNLYQGLLGVDNAKALRGSPLQRVLYRYENKDDECDPHNQPPPFAASLLNFAVLAFIVGKFGRKPLVEALAKRKSTIMTEIDSATRLKEQAEARLGEYEQKFETIDEKLETARAEYQAVAEQEKTRLLDEARERRARMRRDAEFRIAQELKGARVALLNEAATGAVRAAEELLKAQLSASDHDQFAEDYLKAIANLSVADRPKAPQTTGATS
jgi:F-type H+-transporting ATPase subunit b